MLSGSPVAGAPGCVRHPGRGGGRDRRDRRGDLPLPLHQVFGPANVGDEKLSENASQLMICQCFFVVAIFWYFLSTNYM